MQFQSIILPLIAASVSAQNAASPSPRASGDIFGDVIAGLLSGTTSVIPSGGIQPPLSGAAAGPSPAMGSTGLPVAATTAFPHGPMDGSPASPIGVSQMVPRGDDEAFRSATSIIYSIGNSVKSLAPDPPKSVDVMSMVSQSTPTASVGGFQKAASGVDSFFTGTVKSGLEKGATKVASGFSAATSGVGSGLDKVESKVSSAAGSASSRLSKSSASHLGLNTIATLFGVSLLALFLL